MCWNGKNPQKALQHHSRRKLQFSYRPTNKHREKKSKMYIYCTEIRGVKKYRNLQLTTCHRWCFRSLISRGRLFHSLTILFIKLNSWGWGHLITWKGPMMGHLNNFFGLRRGEFRHKFSKHPNARGVYPRGRGGGMFKLRFDWYITKIRNELQQISELLESILAWEIHFVRHVVSAPLQRAMNNVQLFLNYLIFFYLPIDVFYFSSYHHNEDITFC